MPQKRAKRHPLEILRWFKPTQIDQSRKDVDQFHHCFRIGARLGHAGNSHHERDASSDVEQRHFTPLIVLPKMVAVVGCENDDRVIPVTTFTKRIKNQLDLSIHERNARVVGLDILPPQVRVFSCRFKSKRRVSFGQRLLWN